MLDVSSHLTALSGPLALLLVVGIVFAETGLLVGFFLPGDSLLFSAGVLIAGGALHVSFAVMAVAVAVAAFVGDQVGYLLGRRAGPRLFNRPDSRLFARRHADRAHEFFEHHGPKAVVLARFVPVVRTFTPPVAGVAAMPYRRFVAYNAIGAVAWGVGMLTAGHLIGGVAFVAAHVEVITFAVVALSLVPVVTSALLSRRGSARDDAPADEPAEASR